MHDMGDGSPPSPSNGRPYSRVPGRVLPSARTVSVSRTRLPRCPPQPPAESHPEAQAVSKPPFTHLHVHTQYSLLDGAARLKDMFKACNEMGMTHIAMSDHGNLHGA
ncbi:PHP domain-containing protein, partial [Streptomyces sp. p1417]|nr:PHP domain-containing protein [Streptomyces typhae]